ncbi:response regulator [Salinicola salarius]|uniref:response regulator n=1 Tax=Salinicola salarius TaxID=430457 RepID=UPI0026ECA680|nr:response regulator [Salinicola salarius]
MTGEGEKILIVDDDVRLRRLLERFLGEQGYRVRAVEDVAQMDRLLAREIYSLIVLDLMLPGTDGLTLCRQIRERFPAIPVIMLTARVEEVDRLLGLELGADDYICKPFSPREVVARVKAVLRRSYGATGTDESTSEGDRLTLDEDGWRAMAGSEDLNLTAVEFQLLKVMMYSPGRIFSRDQLMDHMYRDHRIVSERTVDSHVKKLRRKIADVWPDRDIIRSVYGVGYKYQPEE